MSTCVMLAPWSARTVVRADIMPGRSKAVTRMACALMYSPNYNSTAMKQIVFVVCVLLVAVLRSGEAAAQGQPNMYGPTITADQAKSVAAAGGGRGAEEPVDHGRGDRRSCRRSRVLREDGQHAGGKHRRGDREGARLRA